MPKGRLVEKLEAQEPGTTTNSRRIRYYHSEPSINKHNSRNTWNNINSLAKSNIRQNTSHIKNSNAGNFNEYFFQVGVTNK